MHGLINKAIQSFLRDSYGPSVWAAVAGEARTGIADFEPMMIYDPGVTERTLDAAVHVLGRPRATVMEDMGTYIASHVNMMQVRRLLRFGGVDFNDFLHSLDEMRDRTRLALPELELPGLELAQEAPGRFVLRCRSRIAGTGHVILGLLRATADDYGALVLLDHRGEEEGGVEVIGIDLLEMSFAQGRPFDLSVPGR